MRLPLYIALRYLFSKKKFNAINIITGISVFGLALGTAALLLILSVFNGFEDLINNMMSKFNPDVKIVAARGKTFIPDTQQIRALRQLEGVVAVSETLEESALFEYNKSQAFGIVKGVDKHFQQVNPVDSAMYEGKFRLENDEVSFAVVGVGLHHKLGVSAENQLSPLNVYMPKRENVAGLEQPFNKRVLYPSGAFAIQQEFDNQYIITSLDFVRDILNAPEELSSLEVRLKKTAHAQPIIKKIHQLMGDKLEVKDRLQQDAALMKLMNMEKWMAYAIVSLTILLIAFNMVGTLWLMVLEKQPDLAILRSMGASDKLIRWIFLSEGFILCTLGFILGALLAIGLYSLHQNIEGGLIAIAGGIIDKYPVAMRFGDFPVVAITVCSIGSIAALPAALRAQRVLPLIKQD